MRVADRTRPSRATGCRPTLKSDVGGQPRRPTRRSPHRRLVGGRDDPCATSEKSAASRRSRRCGRPLRPSRSDGVHEGLTVGVVEVGTPCTKMASVLAEDGAHLAGGLSVHGLLGPNLEQQLPNARTGFLEDRDHALAAADPGWSQCTPGTMIFDSRHLEESGVRRSARRP